ncbi:hypothetical protein CVT24_008953 [Panaeolus cyanescens]|uniref:DUF6533 domain-containing protein n=1 Tax=Panaeolus cyanescens TaxID=181874 RepID=A0A409YAW0_9AGAR|nr:hypothetical protein CVT24_008953 [Panaeolus cyanescens]
MDPTIRVVGAIALLNAFFFVLSIAAFLVILIINAIRRPALIAKAIGLPLPGCPVVNGLVQWAQWIPATIFELILFLQALYKSITSLSVRIKLKQRVSLEEVLVGDHVLYFFGITLLLIFNNMMVITVSPTSGSSSKALIVQLEFISGYHSNPMVRTRVRLFVQSILLTWSILTLYHALLLHIRPFHASMGIMTCRMLLHLFKFASENLEGGIRTDGGIRSEMIKGFGFDADFTVGCAVGHDAHVGEVQFVRGGMVDANQVSELGAMAGGVKRELGNAVDGDAAHVGEYAQAVEDSERRGSDEKPELIILPLVPCLVWVIHDYFITLEDEINHVWRQKINLGRALYLWIRYYTILLVTFDVVQIHSFAIPGVATKAVCIAMDPTTRTLGAISLWSIEIIMQLRIYALFHSSKKLALFNGLCFLLSIAAFIYILVINAIRRPALIAKAIGLPLPGCPAVNGFVQWAQWIPGTFSSPCTFFAEVPLNSPFHASMGIMTCRMLLHLFKFTSGNFEGETKSDGNRRTVAFKGREKGGMPRFAHSASDNTTQMLDISHNEGYYEGSSGVEEEERRTARTRSDSDGSALQSISEGRSTVGGSQFVGDREKERFMA